MDKLYVGYARVDYTPEESVPLRGYGKSSERMSKNVLDPLYVTCLAFRDEAGQAALAFAMDVCSPGNVCTERWRPAVSRATGIPMERIMVSGSHNHSSPAFDNFEEPSIDRLKDRLEVQFVEVAQAALADCAPATACCTEAKTHKLNFVRRHILEDMTYAGDNYGRLDRVPIKCYETKADPMLRLLKFRREGKKDIMVVNFQVHPHRTGGLTAPDISSDIVGSMRAKLERELDCQVVYFQGGGGNINPTSYIKEDNITADYIEHGEALADYAIKAESTYEPVKLGRLQNLSRVKTFPVDHSQDHRADDARKLLAEYKSPEDFERCTELAQQMGFNSVYHPELLLEKVAMGPEQDIELNVFTIGDVAFAFANYEMFDTNANEIRNYSPFKMTFVCTSCNLDEDHGYMYIPSQIGFDHGGYTVDSCAFFPGTGEKMAREYGYMLCELYHPDDLRDN